MKTIILFLTAALAALLVGCVTPQVVTPVPAAVDIHQCKTTTLVVADGVNTPFSREGLPMFEGQLNARENSGQPHTCIAELGVIPNN